MRVRRCSADRNFCPRVAYRRAYIDAMTQFSPLPQRSLATPDQVVRAFADLSTREQQGLRQIARLRAMGLHHMGWEDLLHEALYRTLAGKRRWPLDVNLVAFLAQTMRSVASEERDRAAFEPINLASDSGAQEDNDRGISEQTPDARTPEALAAANSALRQIENLFADDPAAINILRGLGEGRTPNEIQTMSGMTETEYASTQKRIQRALARKFGKASYD